MKSPGGITTASPNDSRLLAGQLIGGKYRVSHLLGEGGMASVWAGTNERTGKLVALKVIRQRFMATPGAEAFLKSEGLTASRVNHPNVVTVFDLIEHEGIACIVMELLDGVSLGSYIARKKPLGLSDAVGVLLPAMRGVAAAHVQGVIHRDLKPQNIFVCVDGDGRVVTTKVLDFGIAMMVDWARGHSMATMPWLVGTPSYMAPEHIEGSTKLDPRTDVYGFGLLLYETLAGAPAFPASPVVDEVLNRVLNESAIPLREYRPDLPVGIYGIVEKALAKRLEHRFESLNQMMAAIESELAQPPVAAAASPPVPTALMNYTISGPLSVGVPSVVERETSDQYSTQPYTPTEAGSDNPAPIQKMGNEPSRRTLVPINTPATGIAAYRPRTTPVPPTPNPTTTVRLARAIFTITWNNLVRRLRAHRRLRILATPVLVLLMGLVVWMIGRSPQGSGPVVPEPAAPPVAPRTVVVPTPLPAAPRGEALPSLPRGGADDVIPSESSLPPPSPMPNLPRQHAHKPSRAQAPVADKGHGSKTSPQTQGTSDAGAPPSSKTVTRRAGELKVDDF